MENISKHISYKEGIVSATGTRLGIDNTPPAEILEVMKVTAEKLFEPIREHFGQPIRIISFFRCAALNKAVGGAKNSSHIKGEAIDVQATTGFQNSDIFLYLKNGNLPFDQAIWEFGDGQNPDWVHISYREGNNRREFLKAKKVNGKTVYEKF